MRRIAAFLAIPVDEALWPGLVEAARFETMRAEGARLMPGAAATWREGAQTFFRSGANQRWRGVLTADDIALYEDRVRREVSPALAHWLTHGRGGGDPAAMED
jgi:aryl sulfotransferase